MPRGIYLRTPEHNAANGASRKGKKHTLEHRNKIKAGVNAALAEFNFNQGREPISEQARVNMSKALKKGWSDPVIRQRRMAGMKQLQERFNGRLFPGSPGQQPLPIVLDFAGVLCPQGYIIDYSIGCGKGSGKGRHYVLDFAHPEAKVDIEIDGSSHKERQAHDAKRDACLRGLGWKVIRIKIY